MADVNAGIDESLQGGRQVETTRRLNNLDLDLRFFVLLNQGKRRNDRPVNASWRSMRQSGDAKTFVAVQVSAGSCQHRSILKYENRTVNTVKQ